MGVFTATPEEQAFSPAMYKAATALSSYPGPLTDTRFAFVSSVGIFRWHVNDTTTANTTDCIAPAGGVPGRWKLETPFGVVPRGKSAVDVVADSNLTLSGLQNIDGVTGVAGLVVLAAGQTTAANRQPWVMAAGAWTRPTWFDSSAEAVLGSEVYVLQGTEYGGSHWVMSTPTSGSVVLGTTSLGWTEVQTGEEVAIGRTLVPASGDLTGAADSAAIAAALASGDAELVDGATYYVSVAVSVPTGRSLFCRGARATIAPGSSWVNGSANDSRTDSVLRLRGAASGSVNTTLASSALAGDSSILVGSNANMSIGQWLKITGLNQASTDLPISLAKIANISGTTITLDRQLATTHQTGSSSVTSLTPWIGGARPAVEGIFLDWAGKLNCVGIEVTDALDVTIARVAGRGFTRALIDAQTVQHFALVDAVSAGENNALLIVDDAHFGEARNLRSLSGVLRVHGSGIPRSMIRRGPGCVQWHIRNADFVNVAGGLDTAGGEACIVDGLTVSNVDCSSIATRNPDFLAGGGVIFGMGVNGSPTATGPVGGWIAVFGKGNIYSRIAVKNFRGTDHGLHYGIYAHDDEASQWSDIDVLNTGRSWEGGGDDCGGGIIMSDIIGSLWTNIAVRGAVFGIRTRNQCGARMSRVNIEGGAGPGAFAMNAGLIIGHQGNDLWIDGLKLSNAATILFEGDFVSGAGLGPGRAQRFTNVEVEGYFFEEMRPFKIATGSSPTFGTVMRLDPTAAGGGSEALIEATGANARNGIFCHSAKNNGWGMIAFRGGAAKTSGSVAAGDLMQATSGGVLATTGSPAAGAATYLCHSLGPVADTANVMRIS